MSDEISTLLRGCSTVAVATCLLALSADRTEVWAQASTGAPFTASVSMETYTFADPETVDLESVSLLALPFSARAEILRGLSLDVRGAYGRGALKRADGTESTLSGLTDTEVGVEWVLAFASGMANIRGIFLAPTGSSEHDADEARIAGILASELFPFRISTWGVGGGAGVQAGIARATSAGSLGISVGYLAGREFEPLAADQGEPFTYRPGNQLQVRVAADRNLGTSAKASLVLAFQNHQEDQLDGANLYRAGNRFQGVGSYAFAVGAGGSAILYAGGLYSEKGVAIQELAHDYSSRTLLLAGGGVRWPIAGMVLVPSIDTRLFRRGSGLGQGYMAGAGTSLEFDAGGAVVSPGVRLRLGNLVLDDQTETGVNGLDLSLAVRFGGL